MLSLGARRLVDVDRSGNLLGSFDLSTLLNVLDGQGNVIDFNAIEGVTVDPNGTIYLVAEQVLGTGAPAGAQSQLIVLSAPVPEPETCAMLLSGLGMVAFAVRRRQQTR